MLNIHKNIICTKNSYVYSVLNSQVCMAICFSCYTQLNLACNKFYAAVTKRIPLK